jgi:hypothetical protein
MSRDFPEGEPPVSNHAIQLFVESFRHALHLYLMPEDLRLLILAKLPEHAEITGLIIRDGYYNCGVNYVVLPNDERRFSYEYKFDGDDDARERITHAIAATLGQGRP